MGIAGPNHELFTAEVDESGQSVFNSIWLPLLVGAFLVYLITTNAAVGAAVACLKFGWEDTRTAIWLRRVDPDRGRARNYFWLHLAYAFCKVTIAAFLVMFVVAMLEILQRRIPAGNGGPPIQAVVAAIIWIVAFLLSTLATYVAIGQALLGHRKIWLSPQMHAARRRNEFPPQLDHRNVVERIVLMGALFTLIVLLSAFIVAIVGIGPNNGRQRVHWPVVVLLGGMIGGALLIVKTVDVVKKRIAAAFPFEAWNELVGGTGAADLATLMRRQV